MARVRLAPGLRVLRRGPLQWQIGLDPRHALVLPDDDAVRRTLAVLAVHGSRADADPDVLTTLGEHRALDVAPEPVQGAVDLRGFGATSLPGVAALLTDAGLHAVDPLREPADVGLLVGVGEPERDLLDEWVATGLPHLTLRISEGAALVGPFVVPGRGACLRCVDAHHTDSDPRWPLLVEQHSAMAVRSDGVPDPAPPALVMLAGSWAITDVLGFLTGVRPATWSATLRVPARLADVEHVSWLRHPECGCGWNQALPAGLTGRA